MSHCTPSILNNEIRKPKPIPGWTNIYELLPNESHLFGTESLFGDWECRLFLLLKDFAPTSLIDERKQQSDSYRHHPEFATNKRLAEWLKFKDEPHKQKFYAQRQTCGVLYGSVAANMLRIGNQKSGSLPENILEHGRTVLQFVLEKTKPTLRCVLCMGNEASIVCLGSKGEWESVRRKGEYKEINGVRFIPTFHPAARTGEMREHAKNACERALSWAMR